MTASIVIWQRLLCIRLAGLGKTLEAIATVLLHPRTSATVGPEAEAIKVEDMEETDAWMGEAEADSLVDADSEDRSRKRRKTGKDTMSNVATELPDGAFKGSIRWDDELKLNVHEIKVSQACVVVLIRTDSFPRLEYINSDAKDPIATMG